MPIFFAESFIADWKVDYSFQSVLIFYSTCIAYMDFIATFAISNLEKLKIRKQQNLLITTNYDES